MKKVLFIHGFEGSSDSNWLPWLEGQLQQFGYTVVNETLPNPGQPDFDETMTFLREKIKDFADHDSIVAHSLGAFFALKLAEEKVFDKLYLVAPAVGDLPFENYKKLWPNSNVDSVEKIIKMGVDMEKINVSHKVAVFSEDDPLIPIETAENFDDSWKIVKFAEYGHFQGDAYPDLFYRLMSV